ncbi:class I SAM-dependent methyltransferase [Kaistia nematophila]|uniref:Class I SAM-dependent methyltransferase n=1 Tax=Kaistia nematophila TaxID=2994654 RepID=A0A9X3E1R7_9HYPH|nr:class I SAM-dependent methyltransferase [Kaistia nematophila]MCX5569566.1 class I SAM-dependent methyltransferase [Kaistia nematophila]
MEIDLNTDHIKEFIRSERKSNPVLDRFLSMMEDGFVADEDGHREPLTHIGIDIDSVGVVYFLTRTLKAAYTVETGFGMGTSAMSMLAAKFDMPDHRHISIDPFGLSDGAGLVLLRHLESRYGDHFERVWEASELALPAMVKRGEDRPLMLAMIDGDHRFDGALVDFFYMDRLLAVDGRILIDDIAYPAVETLLNFITTNKPNYLIEEIGRFAVLRKREADDQRQWDHFRAFAVPKRQDWTPRELEPVEPKRRSRLARLLRGR